MDRINGTLYTANTTKRINWPTLTELFTRFSRIKIALHISATMVPIKNLIWKNPHVFSTILHPVQLFSHDLFLLGLIYYIIHGNLHVLMKLLIHYWTFFSYQLLIAGKIFFFSFFYYDNNWFPCRID